MAYDIRPLSFSEILDRAFRVYADNFIVFVGIAALFWIPVGILRASNGVLGGAATGLQFILLLVAEPVMHAALIVAIAAVYLNRRISIAEACQSVSLIALPFIMINSLYLLIFGFSLATGAGAFVISAAIFQASPMLAMGLLAVVLVVVLAAIVVEGYFLICWSLVGPVMVVERRFGRSALRRSRELVVGSSWRTLGILLTAFLIADIPAHTLKFIWGSMPVIGGALTHATIAVTSTYGVVALMIYYIDRRCRTEDFDLRILAEEVRIDSHPALAPARRSSALA
jgi:hypothetical protein